MGRKPPWGQPFSASICSFLVSAVCRYNASMAKDNTNIRIGQTGSEEGIITASTARHKTTQPTKEAYQTDNAQMQMPVSIPALWGLFFVFLAVFVRSTFESRFAGPMCLSYSNNCGPDLELQRTAAGDLCCAAQLQWQVRSTSSFWSHAE